MLVARPWGNWLNIIHYKSGVAVHKAILIMLLAVVSSSAIAEWANVGSNEGIGLTFYADPTTIRKTGNKVKMWDLSDYKSVQEDESGKKYLSGKTQQEYDCKKEQIRILAISLFSGNMGVGQPVYFSSIQQTIWDPVVPGSKGESLWKIACWRSK